MEIIALNDENRLGTGMRVYLLLKTGRKWVRLLSLGNLRKISVTTATAAHAKPVDITPLAVTRLINRLIGYYRYRLTAHDLTELKAIKRQIRRGSRTQ